MVIVDPGPAIARSQPDPVGPLLHRPGPKPMGEATPSAPSFFFLPLGQFSFGPVDVFFGSANLANFQGFADL